MGEAYILSKFIDASISSSISPKLKKIKIKKIIIAKKIKSTIYFVNLFY